MSNGNRKPNEAGCVVLTVGHSTRSLEDFIALLRAWDVQRVVDIRSIPRSRHNPQFNRESLPARLRAARIGYVYLGKLGGRRRPKADSANMGWRNASFRGFADYMQTPEFEAGLERLLKLARSKRSAILCAEAVPWRCHRSLVADALLLRGVRVEHLLTPGKRQVHRLTPFARVRRGRISYPETGSDGGVTAGLTQPGVHTSSVLRPGRARK